MSITEFKLIGLSTDNRCTISVDGTYENWFHAKTNLAEDRFKALFEYFKNGPECVWKSRNVAVVQHNGLSESGTLINPLVIEVKLDV